MRVLNGPEMGRLSELVFDAYTSDSLSQLLVFRLDTRLDKYAASSDDFETKVFKVVRKFNQQGKIPFLINAIMADLPFREDLQDFALQLNLQGNVYRVDDHLVSSRENLDSALEKMVNSDPLMDLSVFLKRLSAIEPCVCRIEVGNGEGFGTGFLVGPDLLLTNFHVLEPLIKEEVAPEEVSCTFDYKVLEDSSGTLSINKGKAVKLHSDPVLAWSPYGPLDIQGGSLEMSWPEDQLDYALVRLAEPLGELPFGPVVAGMPKANTRRRGWIDLKRKRETNILLPHIIIVQHPNKGPLKVAMGFSRLMGMDVNKVRLRYNVNTDHGSSGSPCFNHKLECIALHNMGDPSWNPKYNQGIPVERIVEDLGKKGFNTFESQ